MICYDNEENLSINYWIRNLFLYSITVTNISFFFFFFCLTDKQHSLAHAQLLLFANNNKPQTQAH